MFCHPLWLEDSCLPSHPTSSGLKPRLPLDTPGSFLNSVGGIHSCVQKNQTARNIWTYPPHPPSLFLSSAQPCYYFHSSKHFHQVSVHPCYGIPWSGSIAVSTALWSQSAMAYNSLHANMKKTSANRALERERRNGKTKRRDSVRDRQGKRKR